MPYNFFSDQVHVQPQSDKLPHSLSLPTLVWSPE